MHDKEKKLIKLEIMIESELERENITNDYIKGTKLKGRQLLQRERTMHLPLIYLVDAEGDVEYQKALCSVHVCNLFIILYIYSYFFTFIPKTSKSMQ